MSVIPEAGADRGNQGLQRDSHQIDVGDRQSHITDDDDPAGQADNVAAEGQTIDLSGSGSTLAFIGAGDFGSAAGTGTVTYTDGTAQSFDLSLADWYNDAPQAGGTLVATTHWNTSAGPGTHQVGVYSASVPLQAGKTVQSVTLPAVSSSVVRGTTAMHIFSIGIG